MSRFNETSVVVHDCTIVWDGLTRPDQNQDGTPKYVLKVVIPPNNPDLAEFNQIAQERLQQSKFNGVLPQGGRMPVGTAGPQEFGGMFPGWAVISAKTKFMPPVHSEDNSILDPMQWAAQVFPGQRVNLLLDCYEYDAMGNKGIGTGLQGVQLITSAGAQRLALGGGGADTSAAFGGQPGVAPGQPMQPQGQPPIVNPPGAQPHGGYAQPQPGPYAPPSAVPGAPPATPPVQQQQQGTAAPPPLATQPPPAMQQPAAVPGQPVPGAPQYPQQAQGFIPPQQQ